jgi:transposase
MGVVEQSGRVVKLNDGRTKRFRPKEERRRIVEETLKRGASVWLVARAHDVNANQVFKWRKQYGEGGLDPKPSSDTRLPVKISESLPAAVRSEPATPSRRRVKAKRAGIIDIDLGHARVRIEGMADPDCAGCDENPRGRHTGFCAGSRKSKNQDRSVVALRT